MFAKESYLHQLQDPKLKGHKPINLLKEFKKFKEDTKNILVIS